MDISKCSTDSTVEGDSFEDILKQQKLVVFIHEKGPLECYSVGELKKWFDTQEKLFYWHKGPIPEKPVYKLMHTGIWVDRVVHDLLFINKRPVVSLV